MKHLLIIFSLLLTSFSWSKDVYFDDLVLRKGNGEFPLWYEKFSDVPFTGTIIGRTQGKIVDGKEQGEHLYYYESGQLWERTNYKDGKKEGEQFYYHENGDLNITNIYKDNKLIETIRH